MSYPLKDLHISVTPATSQIRVPDGSEIIFPSRSVRGSTPWAALAMDFPASCYRDGIPPCRNWHWLWSEWKWIKTSQWPPQVLSAHPALFLQVIIQRQCQKRSTPRNTPFVLPEPEPFEQEVIIDIVFPGDTGNRGSWLQSQFNHLKFNSFENDLRGSADNVFAP